ncbi:DMT family transporter [Celeribacter arenosi]
MSVAVACFTGIDTSAKWLVLAGIPVLQVVFCRYIVHFVIALTYALATEGSSVLKSANPRIQILRSLALLGATAFNFFALQYLPITITISIFFAQPMVIALLAIPILGERIGIRRFTAILVAFLGVVVVIQPWGAAFHPALFFSILALVSGSIYFVLTRKLAGVEKNVTSQIWTSAIASVAIAPFALSIWVAPQSFGVWVMLVVIGLFGLSGHILATAAFRFASATTLAPVVYEQLFYGTLVGWVIFGTWPTVWTVVGAAIIIASGIYIWRREAALGISPPRPRPAR